MTAIARAPLRIGLAGGGTDVSPYTERFGGLVINATVDLYAFAEIKDIPGEHVRFSHAGYEPFMATAGKPVHPMGDLYDLHCGAYNRFCRQLGQRGVSIETRVDVPLGSGLGTSSTLLVAILGALLEFTGGEMSRQDIAALAYTIERVDLGHAGGRQDQYAACFGGFNQLWFEPAGMVRMAPLSLPLGFASGLEEALILFYTSHSRVSSHIIEEQIHHVEQDHLVQLEAMHSVKEQTAVMYEALTTGSLDLFADALDKGFREKRKMASGISNPNIEKIYRSAISAGALAGKISGAGGGGFMVFCCRPGERAQVMQALHTFEGRAYPFRFENKGLVSWRE